VIHKIFFRPVFGRFRLKTAVVRVPIFPASHILFRPVLSYFAEFSAVWQQLLQRKTFYFVQEVSLEKM
jgi:hypothetical protein